MIGMPAFSLPTLLRVLAVWLLIMVAESAQGALREWLASPAMEFAARQAAVLSGTIVIFAITWFSLRWLRLRSDTGAVCVGLLWAGLTVAFELGLGRIVGLGWDRLLQDYDLLHGGLMPLGLLAMALTPWLVRRLQLNASEGTPS
jgi:hypothetical protein